MRTLFVVLCALAVRYAIREARYARLRRLMFHDVQVILDGHR